MAEIQQIENVSRKILRFVFFLGGGAVLRGQSYGSIAKKIGVSEEEVREVLSAIEKETKNCGWDV